MAVLRKEFKLKKMLRKMWLIQEFKVYQLEKKDLYHSLKSHLTKRKEREIFPLEICIWFGHVETQSTSETQTLLVKVQQYL